MGSRDFGFEQLFVDTLHTGRLPLICTFKMALRLWLDVPRRFNQMLRY